MRIEITTDATEFRSRAEAFLLRDPLRHTVIATVIANRIAGLDVTEVPEFVSVHQRDDAVVGAAMRAADRGVYLGELPVESVPAVAGTLADAEPYTGSVEGAYEAATTFAERWCALVGGRYRQTYATRLYRLGVLRIPDVAGSPRVATESDVGLCVDWLDAMSEESGISGLRVGERGIRARVASGRWWLWEHRGCPTSLVAHQLPMHGWSRIGPVYTPPDERGHGYASALSAHVAHRLRADGLDVCLFADTANRTSNKIYQAIGFHPTHEFVHHEFS
ncbi:GNAT family N-acetyltransferase [Nocardia sp. NPDC052566]|uniref:GNAT family N-acetyltransferase n=1 Tax=Nocardia sp. NPDC052566 TaxID=3364330 RepID=UPI0037CA4CD4